MDVRTHADARGFLHVIEPLVGDDEARHNLILGIVGIIATHPERYPEYHLWSVESGGAVAAAAMMTPPFPLALARPRERGALTALVSHLIGERLTIPGVSGAEPEAEWFAELWAAATGTEAHLERREGIYRLREVAQISRASGAGRPMDRSDHDRAAAWTEAFVHEALPEEAGALETGRRSLEHRLDPSADAGLWVWEDAGRAVAMAGYSGPTPNGIRVGPVYTPPEARGNGYATSLVAEMSAALLADGRSFCFLYTDLANPTSNAIYRRIGYEHVCDARNVRFIDAEPETHAARSSAHG
jgi:uncharacterized protein